MAAVMEPFSAGEFAESLKRQRAAGKQKKGAAKKKKLGPPSPMRAGAAVRPGGTQSPVPPRAVPPRDPRDGGSGKGKGKAVADPVETADPAEAAGPAAEVSPRGESSAPQMVEVQTESARYSFRVPPGHRVFGAHAREGDEWVQHYRTKMSDSALHDPVIARELAKVVMLPRDAEELMSRSIGEVLDELFPSTVRTLHNLTILRDVVVKSYERTGSWQAKIKVAEDLASISENRRREAEERESSLRAELETLRKGREESEALLRVREAELRQSTADLQQTSTDLQHAVAGLTRMTTLHTEAEQRADAADRRSGILEERLTSALESLRLAEEQARSAEDRAKAAEDTAERASSVTARAVQDYKRSAQFRADVTDAGSGAFVCGFEECRRRVGEAFPALSLHRITILEEESGEEDDAAEPDAADQPVEAAVPLEDPPAVAAVSIPEEDPSGRGPSEQGA